MSASWAAKVVACPRCGGDVAWAALEPGRSSLVRCEGCGPFPCFAGVPVLVEDPFAWCARFRDAVLATLAEHDAVDREALAVLDAFARGARGEELFADDWTAAEEDGSAAPAVVKGPAQRSMKELEKQAVKSGPASWLSARVKSVRTLVEVGPGAGLGSAVFSARAERLLLVDRSLRAVLQARRRVELHGGDALVEGVVAEAEALPLRERSIDGLVAEHVVDLLDEPRAFLTGARAAVKRGGRLWLTTPEPSLGGEDDEALMELARESGWSLVQRRDGLPWLRQNSARFVEVYFSQALELR